MRNGFSSPVRFDSITFRTFGITSPPFSIKHPVADAHAQTFHLIRVVQCGPRDSCSRKQHRFQIGDRSQRAGSTDLHRRSRGPSLSLAGPDTCKQWPNAAPFASCQIRPAAPSSSPSPPGRRFHSQDRRASASIRFANSITSSIEAQSSR